VDNKSTSRAKTRADREAIAALVAQEKYAQVMQNSIVEHTPVVEISCPVFLPPLPFAKATDGVLIETIEQANDAHHRITSSKEYAIGLGRFLADQKSKQHRCWGKFVKENFDFSVCTADRYIEIFEYRKHELFPHACEKFSIRLALNSINQIKQQALGKTDLPSKKSSKAQASKRSACKIVSEYSLDTLLSALVQRYGRDELISKLQLTIVEQAA
jgi:hypothetical protein